MAEETQPIKPGEKTSEFWGKTVVQIIGLISIVAGLFGKEITPEMQKHLIDLGMLVVALVEGSYAVSRGLAKKQ